MKVVSCEMKEVIPLTADENGYHERQSKCFICDKRFCYECGECKNEWEEPLDHKLIETFPSVYEFSEGDLERFLLLLRKGVYPCEYMGSWEKFEEY